MRAASFLRLFLSIARDDGIFSSDHQNIVSSVRRRCSRKPRVLEKGKRDERSRARARVEKASLLIKMLRG